MPAEGGGLEETVASVTGTGSLRSDPEMFDFEPVDGKTHIAES